MVAIGSWSSNFFVMLSKWMRTKFINIYLYVYYPTPILLDYKHFVHSKPNLLPSASARAS